MNSRCGAQNLFSSNSEFDSLADTFEIYQHEVQKVLAFLQVDEVGLETQILQEEASTENPNTFLHWEQETTSHPFEQVEHAQEKLFEPKICSQCRTTNTPLWRRGENHLLLCNKCGLRQKRRLCSEKNKPSKEPSAKRVKYESVKPFAQEVEHHSR